MVLRGILVVLLLLSGQWLLGQQLVSGLLLPGPLVLILVLTGVQEVRVVVLRGLVVVVVLLLLSEELLP